MVRYHINPKTGMPSVCHAKIGNCPYGGASGSDMHFKTYSMALTQSQLMMEKEHSLLPLDDYGLSMLSIIVNENGELAYCTCRWNHDSGGSDNIMNAVEISKVVNVNEGTIYPILKRLTNEKYFDTYLKESTGGPSRKYYRLTILGKQRKKELLAEWKKFESSVNSFIKESEL